MTKVLHIIPPVKFGGGETLLLDLLLMGKEMGNDEQVCCLYSSPEFESALDDHAITWCRLSNINLKSGPSRLLSKFYAVCLFFKIPNLVSMIDSFKPDVVHVHGFPSVFIGQFACSISRMVGVKKCLVYTHHWVSSPKGFIERFIFGSAFKGVGYITAVSHASLKSLLRDHPEIQNKSAVVKNFASPVFFDVGASRKYPPSKSDHKVTFINVARFAPFKNQMSIVEAVGRLSESERSRVKVVLVGDGETLPTVKARVNDLHLDDHFEFKGFVPHVQVAQLLANANVMIFPSHNEGSPIAIAEALAAGLPVLGLRRCAPVVEVAGSAGIFVDELNLDNGIRELLQADLYALSIKARERAKDFDPIVIKKLYMDIYQRVQASR